MVQGSIPVDNNAPTPQQRHPTSKKLHTYCDAMICCFETTQDPCDVGNKALEAPISTMLQQGYASAPHPAQIFEAQLS